LLFILTNYISLQRWIILIVTTFIRRNRVIAMIIHLRHKGIRVSSLIGFDNIIKAINIISWFRVIFLISIEVVINYLNYTRVFSCATWRWNYLAIRIITTRFHRLLLLFFFFFYLVFFYQRIFFFFYLMFFKVNSMFLQHLLVLIISLIIAILTYLLLFILLLLTYILISKLKRKEIRNLAIILLRLLSRYQIRC